MTEGSWHSKQTVSAGLLTSAVSVNRLCSCIWDLECGRKPGNGLLGWCWVYPHLHLSDLHYVHVRRCGLAVLAEGCLKIQYEAVPFEWDT